MGEEDCQDIYCWTFTGFCKDDLNTKFYADEGIKVQGRKTFWCNAWDESEQLFMYWQAAEGRWGIMPRLVHGEDVLAKIVAGHHEECRGFACQDIEESDRWWEC